MSQFTRYKYTATICTDKSVSETYLKKVVDKAINKMLKKANFMNVGWNSLETSEVTDKNDITL